MFFIFPGLIFRKFLFVKHDVRQFDKGNLFERFSLTLLNSVMLLVVTFSLCFFLNKVMGLKLLESLSYDTFRDIFKNLQSNTLPPSDQISRELPNYLELFLYIYVFSAFLGFSFHKITNYKRIKSCGLFRKSNYWHDLIIKDFSNDKGNKKHKHLRTLADVLVVVNNETKLYTGTVKDYYLNANDSSLQTIVLKDTFRYKGKEKIKIPGDLFVIDNRNIANINLLYIYSSKPDYKIIEYIIALFFLTGSFFIVSAPFFDFMNSYTPTLFRKMLFILVGLPLWLITLFTIREIFVEKKLDWSNIGVVVLFTVLLISVLGFISWWTAGFIILGVPTILGIGISILKKD